MDVILEPGDCLFLPVGWWLWVKSLSVSISATFSSFVWPSAIRLLGRQERESPEALVTVVVQREEPPTEGARRATGA